MEYYVALNQFFRRWQRRNQSVGERGLAENIFLIELESDPSRSAKFLGDLLGLEQSSVSRMVNRLIRRGLLKSKVSSEDRRKRRLQLTSKAKKLIREIDKNANARLDELSAGIAKQELKQLIRFMQRIADGFKHPRAVLRKSDHPLRAEQRRVTRCLGLLGKAVIGGEMSSTAWHLLSEVCEAENGLVQNELVELLYLAPNTVSASLSKLAENGLISRIPSEEDLRKVRIAPTKKGRKTIKRIRESAAKRLQEAMQSFSKAELQHLTEILEKFTGASELYVTADTWARILVEKKERIKARAFLVENLAALGFQDHAPVEFVGPKNITIGLYYQGVMHGLCQFSLDPSCPQLNAFVWLPSSVKDKIIMKFLTASLRLFFNHSTSREVKLCFPPLDRLAKKALKLKTKQECFCITRKALFERKF